MAYKRQPSHRAHPVKRRCVCNNPKDSRWTATCYVCGQWFHFDCAGLGSEMKELVDDLACQTCEEEAGATSRFHEKCRLDSCFKQAGESGYCNTGHNEEEYCKQVLADDSVSRQLSLKILNELHADEKVDPARVAEAEEFAPIYEAAVERRATENICGFDPRVVGLHIGEVCAESQACGRHNNWVTIGKNRLRRLRLSAGARRAPRITGKRDAPLGVTIYEQSLDTGGSEANIVGFFVPYVWRWDADWVLNGHLSEFYKKEYGRDFPEYQPYD